MAKAHAAHYLLDHADVDRERQRLDLLSKLYDPSARDKIRQMGLESGDICLEAGFGNGSMLTWLADRVAPGGRVIGLDREPRFVDVDSDARIEIIHGDVMTTDLGSCQADLVYARLLLEHVSSPLDALTHLVKAAKPGGRLFVMATDFTPFGAADPTHFRAAEFDGTWEILKEKFETTQLMELAFGPKLPSLFRQAGLHDIEHDFTPVEAAPGSDYTREYLLAAASLADLRADFAAACRTMIEIASDPAFSFHYQNIHRCSGRKPEHQHEERIP